MALLYSYGAANQIGVANVVSSSAWYIEKLGLRKVKVELDNGEDCIALGFDKDDCAICLGHARAAPKNSAPDSTAPAPRSSRVSRLSRRNGR